MRLGAGEQLEHLRLAARVSNLEDVDVALPEEHDVSLGGMRLHYLDWGTDGHPPVVFLHGGALTAHTWDVVCLALRRDHHCLALDQRGHGDSEWSPAMEYGVEDHLGDIERFVDHLGLDRFVLVGQSMGALNAIVYASRHSDRLAGLVSIDAGPEVSLTEGASRIVDFVQAPGELDSVEEFVKRAQSFNPLRDPRLLRTSLLHNLRKLPNGKWTWKYDRRPLAKSEFHLTTGSHDFLGELPSLLDEVRGMVSSIHCPTLVVRGALSDVISDAQASRFAELLPDGRWTRVAGAAHTVQGDNPRGLVEALRRFFAEIGL
jgi:esterase